MTGVISEQYFNLHFTTVCAANKAGVDVYYGKMAETRATTHGYKWTGVTKRCLLTAMSTVGTNGLQKKRRQTLPARGFA